MHGSNHGIDLAKAATRVEKHPATPKSQSAMEYLMTYGWAILIIAVVLGALYQFGVFNTLSAPRAVPGACKVFRPSGSGTTVFINLEGVCTGQFPQSVASFDGHSSTITTSTTYFPTGSFTVSFWVLYSAKPSLYSGTIYLASYGACVSSSSWDVRGLDGSGPYSLLFTMPSNTGSCDSEFGAINLNTWYHITVSYSTASQTENDYVNGLQAASHSTGTITLTSPSTFYMGTSNLNGYLSNVQIYNTSLDAGQVQTLYSEGIGGAPISLPYLVGWWPLNGDVKDYSGNNNNGAATSVSYQSAWTSGYRGH